MMRASVFRLSPLLLLAAALVALAVFVVQDSPPASADHDERTTVWSATLTVKQTAGFGCTNAVSGAQCSSSSVLTNDNLDGASIVRILTNSGTLVFQFDGTFQKNWTLHVGSSEFPLTEATLSTSSFTNDTATWTSTGLTWAAGDTVELRLDSGPLPYGAEFSAESLAVTEGGTGTFTVVLTEDPGTNKTVHLVRTQFFQSVGEPGHV